MVCLFVAYLQPILVQHVEREGGVEEWSGGQLGRSDLVLLPLGLRLLLRQLYKNKSPGKLILGDYFQKNRISQKTFSLT